MRKARIYDARQLPAYLSPAQYAALMGVNLKTVHQKATILASLWYMAAMLTAIGALLVSSGIELSANGWEMLGWAAAALVLLAAALAMLGLGCCADKESRKGNKAHKAPAVTVKPKSRRKAG